MEKIEILCNYENWSFVANTGLPYVSISAATPYGVMYNSIGNPLWTSSDNCRILSFCIGLPLGFELVGDYTMGLYMPPRFYMSYLKEDASANLPFPDVFKGSWVYKENYETQIDAYVPVPDAVGLWGRFLMCANVDAPLPKISMLGVDESLDGMIFPIFIYVKVLHNLDLLGLS